MDELDRDCCRGLFLNMILHKIQEAREMENFYLDMHTNFKISIGCKWFEQYQRKRDARERLQAFVKRTKFVLEETS